MTPTAPRWLIERPIAHRGLHDESLEIVENTIAAARAAAEKGFAIECDVQMSADGQAVVFHDETLDRLTLATGRLKDRTAAELAKIAFRTSASTIPTLPKFLDAVAGRVAIICEIKSQFDGDLRLAERVASVVADYRGPLAIKSFDPALVAHLRTTALAPSCPLGIVAQATYEPREWPSLTPKQRADCQNFLHYYETRPDFLSFRVDDLPHATPFLLRGLVGLPIMAWTVRTVEQRRKAAHWADQIVFEGDGRA
ncbi:MAG TPA: glycerophosphodiester phosphodiesterase family protein [Roseiarcus sp.]|nr:glycerophosphodiester phosphodiesterase family protein [Roseiarcus sp.]